MKSASEKTVIALPRPAFEHFSRLVFALRATELEEFYTDAPDCSRGAHRCIAHGESFEFKDFIYKLEDSDPVAEVWRGDPT